MYENTLLDKLNRKLGRYAIRNLMTIIVIGTALVWLFDTAVYTATQFSVAAYLYFDKALILQGQIWRVFTFVFVPQQWSLFSFVISTYLYWLIGNTLESEWGSFKFNVFYFCGVLCSIGSGFITGYATAEYLHLSLFLAFAILYPDFQVLLFFFIPIKMKWLALIDVIGLVAIFIFSGWTMRIALLVAMLNIVLFFWRYPVQKIKAWHRRRKWKQQTKTKNSDDYPFEL